ncbi:MAG TPA: tetratricopeptide repeat protein [Alphaproteobacteria bacterium]|mgnify:FL=1|nr:tetratricopeptide repeat protein [Alphaproteobacteria bacterium]
MRLSIFSARALALVLACAVMVAGTQMSHANDSAGDDMAKSAEVPFREDSGLITAEYYLATGKYMQSLDVLGGVLQRHPQNADAYVYRGYAYQKLGDKKKARENYRTALTLNPRHLGANKYVGNLWLEDGDLARAMEQLQAMIYICAGTYCAEVDELQNDINRFRTQKKSK